jgi:glycosyltransferase involved in cell wall biosynthesis
VRVCFCTHRLPYPPVSGGKRETFKLVEALSDAGHAVDLVTYCDDAARAEELAATLGGDCAVDPVPGAPDRTPWTLARNVVSPDPLPVTKARTARFERAVRDRADGADVVHLHALQTAHLADAGLPAPTVLRFNNVKHEIYRQFAARARNPATAAYAYLQFYKTRRYEARAPAASDLSLTITDEDRATLRDCGASGDIEVLPAGVDPSAFPPADHDPDGDALTFFGSMDYHPNEEGAVWFVEEVLPRIRAERPDVTLELVGKDPPPAVRRLGDRGGVRVTGYVEDLAAAVGRATVVVLPVRVGTGVRMKALHAMAMGKPMVSTPLGVQGIAVADGTHVSVAEDPAAFAGAVLDLLADPERQRRYRERARSLVTADHDWGTIGERLVAHYERVGGAA